MTEDDAERIAAAIYNALRFSGIRLSMASSPEWNDTEPSRRATFLAIARSIVYYVEHQPKPTGHAPAAGEE